MYTIEQLRAIPAELTAQRERIDCGRLERDAVAVLNAGFVTTRRILEGLQRVGTDDERLLAETALEELQRAEKALARRVHDAELARARDEIDGLNMDVFLQYLAGDEPELRIRAVIKAAAIDFEATIPAMKRRIVVETSPHVVSAIVKAVGILGRTEEMAFLGQYLDHECPRVRANAIEGMACSEATSRFNLFAAMLGDDHHRVRLNAAVALIHEESSALSDVLGELWHDPSTAARRGAMWVAGHCLAAGTARANFLRGLADPHVDVILSALGHLGSCDDPEVAARLIDMAASDDVDELVRNAVRERVFSLQASTRDDVRAVVVKGVERLLAGSDASEGAPRVQVPVPDREPASSHLPSRNRLRPPKDDGPREAPPRTMWVRLAGRVVYGVRKDPLPQVTIRLSNTGFHELSDRHGRFCFDRIEANKVHVFVCEKQGWSTTTCRYRASGERDQRILVRMQTRGSGDRGR